VLCEPYDEPHATVLLVKHAVDWMGRGWLMNDMIIRLNKTSKYSSLNELTETLALSDVTASLWSVELPGNE